MEAKKKVLTYAGLKALEDELENLKVVKRREIAQKIKEAREQGDLSENAEYDAAKDEQMTTLDRLIGVHTELSPELIINVRVDLLANGSVLVCRSIFAAQQRHHLLVLGVCDFLTFNA